LPTGGPGSELEQAVARRLQFDGYDAVTNSIVQGRSGARHEIDVLAIQHLGSTKVSLAVECKSWMQSIDKAVIAKAKFVGDDIGADKVLVVAPGGVGPGAEAAARELGVEVWGPQESREHLAGFDDAYPLDRASSGIVGIPFNVRLTDIEKWLERRSRAGFRRKRIVRQGPVHVPCAMVFGSITKSGLFRTQAEQRWWTFDLLTESLLDAATSPLPLSEIPPRPFLMPWAGESEVVPTLAAALDVLVDRDTSRDLKDRTRKLLNVPAQIESYSLGRVEVFFLGCHVAVFEHKGKYEVALLRGLDGKEWPDVENSLSRDFARFSGALDEAGL
jgi:hypothetical protein